MPTRVVHLGSMRRVVVLRDLMDDVHLVGFGGNPPEGESHEVAPRVAAQQLATWFSQRYDPALTPSRAIETLSLQTARAESTDDVALSTLASALRQGGVRAFRVKRPARVYIPGDDATDIEIVGNEVRATHWIEIELVDMEGMPVVSEPYEITMPDGKTRKGRTDRNGIAYLTSQEAGSCTFTFTKLDQEAWEPA